MTPQGYLLTDEQRTALINYLARHPYSEVHQAIDALSQLPAVSVQQRPATSPLNEMDHPSPTRPNVAQQIDTATT